MATNFCRSCLGPAVEGRVYCANHDAPTPDKRYRVTYRDPDPCSPDFTVIKRAYSYEDCEERFLESNDGDDWRIVKIERVEYDVDSRQWRKPRRKESRVKAARD